MDIKIFLFIVLLCLLKTNEVESHEFLKSALKSVKDVVVKGYHHVAHIFVKHDHEDDEDFTHDIEDEEEKKSEIMEQEIITTTIEPVIDIRFQEIQEPNKEPPPSFRRQDASDDSIPDLDSRFLINAPCGGGTRKSASGCREVIKN